jgi:hypothetical protein
MFLQYDNSGNRHRWGYVYNSKTGTLKKCTAYSALAATDYDTTCTGVTSTSTLSTFTVSPILVSAQTAAFGLPAQNDVAIEMDSPARDPDGVVTAGNAIKEISLSASTTSRTIDIIQGGVPLSVGVIAHHNTAPAVGAVTGPAAISAPIGGLISETYSVTNINQYAPYLGANGGWSVTPCSGTGAATPVVSGTSGDDVTIGVSGLAVGTCSFNVAVGTQSFPVTVTVNLDPHETPTPAPPPTIDKGTWRQSRGPANE